MLLVERAFNTFKLNSLLDDDAGRSPDFQTQSTLLATWKKTFPSTNTPWSDNVLTNLFTSSYFLSISAYTISVYIMRKYYAHILRNLVSADHKILF